MVDKKELENFVRYYGRVMKAIPGARQQAIYAAAKEIQKDVQEQVDRQGIQDGFGRVKRWQQVVMGSRGGYAKVKPMPLDKNPWGYTGQDITRYLERGHGVPKPSGKDKRYAPRMEKVGFNDRTGNAYVPGFMFYSWARMSADKHALNAARKVLDAIEDQFEFD